MPVKCAGTGLFLLCACILAATYHEAGGIGLLPALNARGAIVVVIAIVAAIAFPLAATTPALARSGIIS